MSVLQCSRDYCENVMCDRMSVEHGYICEDCYNELRAKPWCNIAAFFNSEDRPSNDVLRKWENHLEAMFRWRK